MKAKVALLARVHDGSKAFPFVAAIVGRRGIVLPIEGKTGRLFEPDSIIGFYARYSSNGKRKIQPLGKDPVDAYARFQAIERDFARAQDGLLPLDDPKTAAVVGHDIKTCVREFKEDNQSRGLKERSIETYNKSVDDFAKSCSKGTLEEITKRDILSFIDWMRTNYKTRAFGQPNNTYRNRLKDITVLFNHFGLKMPLPKREWPKSTRKNADKYALDTINKMLAVSNEDEKDLISFFLYTGFRDEEAIYAKYSDIDFRKGTINVHDKPEFGWTVKDHEQRTQDIVLPEKFVKRMEKRQARYHATSPDLIFPAECGKPNEHLIYIPQRVAIRAGIEERITLHKFRRTFGTVVAKQFGIETARLWLGHSDIATTQRYLAADEMVTEQSRKAVNQMYGTLGD
jgi:integrase